MTNSGRGKAARNEAGDPAPGGHEAPNAGQGRESGPDSGVHDGQKFGPWLRSQRELRGIELREISEASKISLRYLEAMESGDFHLLPAAVFTKGFLRQYASYVGLDPEEVVSFYLAACQALDEEAGERSDLEVKPPPRSGPQAWHFLLLAAILAAVILGILWGLAFWLRDGEDGSLSTTASEERPAAASTADGQSPGTGNSAARPPTATSGTSPSGGETADPTAERAGGRAASETSGGSGTGAQIVGSGPVDVASAGTVSADSGTAISAPISDSPVWLALDFLGPCWVEASVDGQRQLAEMRIQGESLLLEASSRIELRLGDVTAVRMELNGMPYDPGLGPGGNVVRGLTVDLETVGQLRAGNSAP